MSNNPFDAIASNITKYIETGIVVDIDKTGRTFSSFSPVGSCRIRLTGDKTVELDNQQYFTPFFPPNQIVLPSEGEEVFVMFPNGNRRGQGYWYSRRATTVDYYEYGLAFKKDSLSLEAQYGGKKPKIGKRDNTLVKPIAQKEYLSGDVAIIGNAGNGINFSYNPKNGESITDIFNGSLNKKTDGLFNYDKAFGRIIMTQNYPLDSTLGTPITNKKTDSTAYVISNNIRLYSPVSKNNLENSVLGIQQMKWLESTIDILSKNIDKLISSLDAISTHVHPTSQGPTSAPITASNFVSLKTELETINTDLKAQKKTIVDHHSTHNFIN